MGNLGVFRDEFYNAIHILPASQGFNGPTVTGVLPAAGLAGALECVTAIGNGGAGGQTYTTDTAVNIINQINTAINTAYKANVGGFASSLGAQPAIAGMPNFFNVSWTITLAHQGTAASTLAGGTGVTLATLNAGLVATNIPLGAPNAPINSRWVVSVTGPTTVTLTRVQ